nr:thermonuclease family protein [Patulibacter sp. SYSU D01012]
MGVDTPESVHPRKPVECFGPAAARANRRWATGRLVTLVLDRERTDPYGRLLAALRPVGARATLSARLVATGHARVLTIPPNGRLAPTLRRLEQAARQARRGMWRACRDGLRSDG